MKTFKNNDDLIGYVESFYDEKSGYLLADRSIPLQSQGNILEKTGQVLVALSEIKEADKLINKIVLGLRKNSIEGFVPRTVSYSKKEPKERKKGLWEQIERVSLGEGTWKKWYRTDVSHSQLAFLFSGLQAVERKQPKDGCASWLRQMIQLRFSIYGYIKKINTTKSTDNGKFYDWGTVGLKKLLIVGKDKANLAMKINFQIMKVISKFPWNSNEKFNMLYFLWIIGRNKNILTKYKIQNTKLTKAGSKELDEKSILVYSMKGKNNA